MINAQNIDAGRSVLTADYLRVCVVDPYVGSAARLTRSNVVMEPAKTETVRRGKNKARIIFFLVKNRAYARRVVKGGNKKQNKRRKKIEKKKILISTRWRLLMSLERISTIVLRAKRLRGRSAGRRAPFIRGGRALWSHPPLPSSSPTVTHVLRERVYRVVGRGRVEKEWRKSAFGGYSPLFSITTTTIHHMECLASDREVGYIVVVRRLLLRSQYCQS